MAVEHAALTGASLHEPKGVAAANSGQVYVANGSGSGSWTTLTASIPVGTVTDFAGSSAPSGWLLCYGQDISRSTYASLFTAIGTTYGVGNGSTTFTLPDCRGRLTVGKDNMGGSTASRITSAGSGITGTTLGAVGGEEAVTLTGTQIPSHGHTVSITDPGHAHAYSKAAEPFGFAAGGGGNAWTQVTSNNTDTTTHTTGITASADAFGGGASHNNVQPSIIFNKIIFTNVV